MYWLCWLDILGLSYKEVQKWLKYTKETVFYIQQILANEGPDSRFVLEAIIKLWYFEFKDPVSFLIQ